MSDYPRMLVTAGHVEPVPRRVRGYAAGRLIFDTTRARYVWEHAKYPWYYIPRADVASDLLIPEKPARRLRMGVAEQFGLVVSNTVRAGAVQSYTSDAPDGIADHLRFEWSALDAWYEEDEQIFVHPRNPYTRVDALRSTRRVRIERDGLLLAQSAAPVLVFETGLPTRYYLDPLDVDLAHLVPSPTRTACPYKGETTAYWTFTRGDAAVVPDIAWCYGFPTRQLLPIAGLVAFYNELVDLWVDGLLLERPVTDFVRSSVR